MPGSNPMELLQMQQMQQMQQMFQNMNPPKWCWFDQIYLFFECIFFLHILKNIFRSITYKIFNYYLENIFIYFLNNE
jgi:hypothetical protein